VIYPDFSVITPEDWVATLSDDFPEIDVPYFSEPWDEWAVLFIQDQTLTSYGVPAPRPDDTMESWFSQLYKILSGGTQDG